MKKLLFILPLLCALLTVSAAAVEFDTDYTGVIDSYTGLPAGQSGDSADPVRAAVSPSVYYDFSAQRFVYPLPGGAEVTSSVANGMITADPVSVTVPEGMTARLFLDGEELTEADFSCLDRPGSYVLSVNANSSRTEEPLHFTIVGEITGRLSEYRLPAGFAFTEVLLDGAPVSFEAQRAELRAEGEYRLTCCCQNTGVFYDLTVTVDHTPPSLALEAVTDGIASGPVDISDLEEGALIRIELDGREEPYESVLTKSGRYVLYVQDAAGNDAVYRFTVELYLNTSAILFVVLLIALFASLTAYLLYARRKLRVR